jgi:hypothetical protein
VPARRIVVSPQGWGPPYIYTPSPLVSGEVSYAYSTQLSGAKGIAPYTFAVVSGALPAGLSLAPNGAISGTPTAVGAASFGVQITDRAGTSTVTNFSLTVVAAITITTPSPLPQATQGSAYSTTIAATGGITPYLWSLVAGGTG